jgi:hypothetical protein
MPFSELIICPYIYKRPLPEFQNGDDIKFPDSLVSTLLKKYTKPGDKVLDPFTGLGTTFFVCEEEQRIPFGVEADQQRYEWVKARMQSKNNLFLGDSGDILSFGFPEIDFSITSPPYMPNCDKWNPLYNGDPAFDGYDRYLQRMKEIYAAICRLMKKDSYLVVQADNLSYKETLSPLVWDLGKALSEIMNLEGEIIFHWSENTENKSQFTQCLVFKNSK